MAGTAPALPEIASRDEWLAIRKELLAKEKELTRARDALNAERRRLPMVAIAEEYAFEGQKGRASLLDLFEGRRQLIVYHFMFDPGDPPPGKSEPWSEGCSGCSFMGRQHPPPGASARAGHDPRPRLTRPPGQDRPLPGPDGLGRPLVFLLRQRLQL
jgi:hypothetical protein